MSKPMSEMTDAELKCERAALYAKICSRKVGQRDIREVALLRQHDAELTRRAEKERT